MTGDWQKIAAAFREPFPASAIKQYKGRGGMTFDYIDARDVENRLDEVVGAENWSDAYEVVDPERMGVKCTLTVLAVSKEGIGYPNVAIGTTNQKGQRIDSDEPGKDAESDALKRAAVKFGIGRHLYEDKPARTPGREQDQRPTESNGKGRAELLKSVMAMCGEVAELRGKKEPAAKVLRGGCQHEGIEVENTHDLSVKDLARLLQWATSQRDILRNSQGGGVEQPAEQQYF